MRGTRLGTLLLGFFAVLVSVGANQAPELVSVSVPDTSSIGLLSTTSSSVDIRAFEFIAIGTLVATLNVVDPDGDPVAFEVLTGDVLSVHATSGNLTLIKNLDTELSIDNLVEVKVSDGSLHIIININLEAIDVNDNEPVFKNGPYQVSVPEDTPTGTSIFTVSAEDVDFVDENKRVIYFIDTGSSVSAEDLIEINAFSGEVSLKTPLDYEQIKSYTYTIVAQNFFASPKLEGRTTLTVGVGDAQDNGPAFLNLPYYTTVPENSPKLHVVQTIEAYDQDTGVPNPIQYELLSGNDEGYFNLDSLSGELRVAKEIDRELSGFQETFTLTVRATETGSEGGATANTTFEVVVMDVNDNSPIFDRSAYNVTVSESVLVGDVLPLSIHVDDIDKDQNAQYNIFLSGDFSELFRTDPISGTHSSDIKLIVQKNLDYEAATMYEFEIRATDSGNLDYSDIATIQIHLINENDFRPVFQEQVLVTEVKEDIGVGSSIAQVTATDEDVGPYGIISYSLTGSDSFVIDNVTGEIYIKQQLDYEETLIYQLTAIAQDGGYPPNDATANILVYVKDVNDNAPEFQRDEYFATIDENKEYLYPANPVTVVRATDKDSPPNSDIVYYLLETSAENTLLTVTNGSHFGITTDSSNGYIYTTEPVDYESILDGAISLTVLAQDLGNPPLNATTTVIIDVLDKNDHGPIFTSAMYNASVPENLAVGGVVAVVTATDNDLSTALGNESIIYSLPSSDLFRVDPRTGAVTTAIYLDRDLGQDSYQIQVTAVDGGFGSEQKSAVSMVYINVNDVNDNDPVLHTDDWTVFVSEDQPVGLLVANITATDADQNENGNVTFAIEDGNDNGAFEIGMISGEVKINSSLDYDSLKQVYHLVIVGSDQGVPVSPATGSSTATLTVSVTDVNDHAPAFSLPLYEFSASEVLDAFSGVNVGLVIATDSDDGINAQLEYNITQGNVNGAFALKSVNSGEIVLQQVLDREVHQLYNMTVMVRDQGSPSLSSECTVLITILDVNDNDPKWTVEQYSANVTENSPEGTFVYQVSAIDLDSGINSELIYELANANPYYQINASQGIITTTTIPLDRESDIQDMTLIILSVRDNGIPTHRATSSATVAVTLLDTNDNPPLFALGDMTTLAASVAENMDPGTTVFQAVAGDADLSESGLVTYGLLGVFPQWHFTIDNATGIVNTSTLLDREAIDTYSLLVKATDSSPPFHVSYLNVTVTVEDENDHTPVFVQYNYSVWVAEDVERTFALLTLNATDSDQGINADVSYYIRSGNNDGKFTLNYDTGVLETIAYLDREIQPVYWLTIEAIDNAPTSKRQTGTTVVEIKVSDVNDNRPVFLESTYDVTVRENITTLEPVVQVLAIDSDIEENAEILYEIIGGNENSAFVISKDTGLISTRGDYLLDRETYPSYILTVEASNNYSKTLRSEVRVNILLEDVNDETPLFSQLIYTRPDLPENSGKGTSVLLVSASDGDLNEGGTVHYSIIAGNEGGAFTIETLSGLITTEGYLDFETQAAYILNISATDQAPPYHIGYAKVEVDLVNVNDEPPTFGQSRYESNVPENVALGTPVVQVSASENDDTTAIQYEFDPNTNPDVLNVFTINKTSGVIATIGDIDREIVDFYSFQVLADDSGPTLGSTTVWITVLDENDQAPVFEVQQLSVTVKEEDFTPLNTTIATLKATDKDIGDYGKISYYLKNESGNFFYVLENSNGEAEVKNVKLLDREEVEKFDLVVVASDGYHETFAFLTVTVEDVNDNKPMFNTSYNYNVSIPENIGGGTLVTKVLALDTDATTNSELQYYLVAGDPGGTFRLDVNTGELTTRPVTIDRETIDFYNLTVIVQDKGVELIQEAQMQVFVYIHDLNDHPPVFETSSYSALITEGPTSLNQSIVNVSATDMDLGINANVLYSFSSGNDQKLFHIDAITGEITTVKELDHEDSAEYILITIATDQAAVLSERQTGMATVTVTVEDINDVSPHFSHEFYGPYDISEGVPGPYIGTFVALDEDDGLNGNVEYSILNAQDKFSISPSDGDLRVSKGVELDRESEAEYNITILAMDRGVPQLVGSTIVQVVVQDINDNDPSFTGVPYSVEISEHIQPNTSIFNITATDSDQGESAAVTYSITVGNIDALFSINSMSGEVLVEKPLDRELLANHVLTITAADSPNNAANSRKATADLTVILLDENDMTPSFTEEVYHGSILENSAKGTAVSMVTDIIVIDGDVGENALFTYNIIGVGSEHFAIDSQTGVPYLSGVLDREMEDQYNLTVTATDLANHSSSALLFLEVADVNDNSPVFLPSLLNASVPENAPEGFEVIKVTVTDADTGLNQEVFYRIDSGGQDKFTINENTGLIKVALGQLLDREDQDKYTLVVIATDRGVPALSGTGIVELRVEDINDSPPYFPSAHLSSSVSEGAAPGTEVAVVQAADTDEGSLLQLTLVSVVAYDVNGGLVPDQSLYSHMFSVISISENQTGVVLVNSSLDRETVKQAVLTISATDLTSTNDAYSTSNPNAQLIIDILDVNDNSPVFQPVGITHIHKELVEETQVETVVTTVTALDIDSGDNAKITYRITENTTDHFTIEPSTGLITVKHVVDREMYSWLNFTVVARDPERETSLQVYIEIQDVNDNNPLFDQPSYVASVYEELSGEVIVTTVTASDADIGSFGEIEYSLAGGDGKFAIDPNMGTIRLLEPLDREKEGVYTLTVTAKDNPSGLITNRRGSSVLVEVTVLDINDNSPVPEEALYFQFSLPENQAADSFVGQVTATDADSGPNQALVFTLSSTSSPVMYFSIDSTSGNITTLAPIDREELENDVIVLTVNISDSGLPSRSVTTSVEIAILDENDNGPIFEHPVYNVSLKEDAFGGTLVYEFVALDPDLEDLLTYAIIAGNEEGTFTIGSKTGIVTTVKLLDHETTTEYLLTVEVKDMMGRTGQAKLDVQVLDVNDEVPIFFPKLYSVEVAENISLGTALVEVYAVDMDTTIGNNEVTYHLTEGNTGNVFSLDSMSGIIYTASNLDRETVEGYQLVLEARNPTESQNNTLWDTATVSITLLDVNDWTPNFTQTYYEERVLENEEVDSVILVVTAEDLDKDLNGQVTYEITNGNIDDQFKIDPNSGSISLTKLFQHNVQASFEYILTITATDQGIPPLYSTTTVHLEIIDYNDREPEFIYPTENTTITILENTEPGHFIVQVVAIDQDLGDNGIVDYSLFQDSNGDWKDFHIDAISGNITTAVTIDREAKPQYLLFVEAMDKGDPPLLSRLALVVTVEDVDDNEPAFPHEVGKPIQQQVLEVPEHAAPGTLVGSVVQALDPDSGDNAQVYYFITTGNDDGYFELDKNTGAISLTVPLDREVQGSYTLLIKASSNSTYRPSSEEDTTPTPVARRRRRETEYDYSVQQVLIQLKDINDNVPVFVKKQYTVGLLSDAQHGTEVIQVEAVDADSGNNSQVHYSATSIIYIDPDDPRATKTFPMAFEIGDLDGQVTTNEKFLSYHQGYFELLVLAKDWSGYNDTAIIRVYILQDYQQVKVVFDDDPDYVKTKQDQFIVLLSNITGALIHVDDVGYHINRDNEVVYTQTDMILHAVNPTTNTIMDVDTVIDLIDRNYNKFEEVLFKFDIVEIVAAVSLVTSEEITLLQALLMVLGFLIFFGTLIYIICVCWIRKKHKRKMRSMAAFSYTQDNGDLLRDINHTAGTNPMHWMDLQSDVASDFPDSASQMGREYEPADLTMDMFHDDPILPPLPPSLPNNLPKRTLIGHITPNHTETNVDTHPPPIQMSNGQAIFAQNGEEEPKHNGLKKQLTPISEQDEASERSSTLTRRNQPTLTGKLSPKRSTASDSRAVDVADVEVQALISQQETSDYRSSIESLPVSPKEPEAVVRPVSREAVTSQAPPQGAARSSLMRPLFTEDVRRELKRQVTPDSQDPDEDRGSSLSLAETIPMDKAHQSSDRTLTSESDAYNLTDSDSSSLYKPSEQPKRPDKTVRKLSASKKQLATAVDSADKKSDSDNEKKSSSSEGDMYSSGIDNNAYEGDQEDETFF